MMNIMDPAMTSPVPIPTHELLLGAVKRKRRSLVFSGMLRAKLIVVAAPSRGEIANVEVEETKLMNEKVRMRVTVVGFSSGRLEGFILMQMHAYQRETLSHGRP